MAIYDKGEAPGLPLPPFLLGKPFSSRDPATTADSTSGACRLAVPTLCSPTPVYYRGDFKAGRGLACRAPCAPRRGSAPPRVGNLSGQVARGGAGLPDQPCWARSAPTTAGPQGRGQGRAGQASSFATSPGSPLKMRARALAFPQNPEVLGSPQCLVSSHIPSQPVRPARPARSSRPADPRFATQGWGTDFPGGLQQSSRRLLAEMPGKKARKNAQPSPPRAPAGRDQVGSAEILAGAGAGAGSGSQSGRGSVLLLRDSRSGPVCSLARALRAPPGSSWGFLPSTVETAREGRWFEIRMQLHF